MSQRWRGRSLTHRFWAKVEKRGPDECWLWLGSKNRKGYGGIGAYGGNVRAHRLSWEFANGPITDGLCVLHRCDVPACVNPSHLFLGTNADNVRDCIEKGRRVHHSGSANANAKLTDSLVTAIIEARKRGDVQSAIAERFGVSRSIVRDVVLGKRWGHLTGIGKTAALASR